MSLLRLLTAGKTLIGLKRSESRYQLHGGQVLPMFGSKKNPFRATVFPDKPEPVPALEESGPGVATAPQANASPVQGNHNLPPHEEHKPVREAVQPSEGTPKQGPPTWRA